jgi:hypothetical protein
LERKSAGRYFPAMCGVSFRFPSELASVGSKFYQFITQLAVCASCLPEISAPQKLAFSEPFIFPSVWPINLGCSLAELKRKVFGLYQQFLRS